MLDGAASDVGVLGAARHGLQVVARPRPEVQARHRHGLAARCPRKLKWDEGEGDCYQAKNSLHPSSWWHGTLYDCNTDFGPQHVADEPEVTGEIVDGFQCNL